MIGWATKLANKGSEEATGSSVTGGDSLFGKWGDEIFGDQMQTSEQNPWGPSQAYLAGGDGKTGLLPESMRLYGEGQNMWAPGSALNSAMNSRVNELGQPINPAAGQTANSLLSGGYDQQIGQLPGANSANVNSAFGSLGGLDPSKTFGSLLSGKPDQAYLDGITAAAGNEANKQYGRMVDTFNNQTNPAIRSGAMSAGQYGGSRHGIVEGLEKQQMLRNAGDMATSLQGQAAQLQGNAYEAAQGRALNTANLLGNFGVGAQNQNMNNLYRTDAARLGQGQQNIENRLSGYDALGSTDALGANRYSNLNNTLMSPYNAQMQNFGNYANTVNTVAGQGGTAKTPNPENRLAQGMGLIGMMGQMYGM